MRSLRLSLTGATDDVSVSALGPCRACGKLRRLNDHGGEWLCKRCSAKGYQDRLPTSQEMAEAVAVALTMRLGGQVVIGADEYREAVWANSTFYNGPDGLACTVWRGRAGSE